MGLEIAQYMSLSTLSFLIAEKNSALYSGKYARTAMLTHLDFIGLLKRGQIPAKEGIQIHTLLALELLQQECQRTRLAVCRFNATQSPHRAELKGCCTSSVGA